MTWYARAKRAQVALIREWIDLPATNHGVAIVRGTSLQHVHFQTRENDAWSTLVLELAK